MNNQTSTQTSIDELVSQVAKISRNLTINHYVSMVVGFVSICLGSFALYYANVQGKETSATLEKLNTSIEENWLMAHLSDDQWPIYKERIAEKAIPIYIEDNTFALTMKGNELLNSSIQKNLENAVQIIYDEISKENESISKKDVPCEKILRKSNLTDLIKQAKKKNVSIDIMVAVANGYANKKKNVNVILLHKELSEEVAQR